VDHTQKSKYILILKLGANALWPLFMLASKQLRAWFRTIRKRATLASVNARNYHGAMSPAILIETWTLYILFTCQPIGERKQCNQNNLL